MKKQKPQFTMIGLDVGYGMTKVVTADQQISFPSVWGLYRNFRYNEDETNDKYLGDQLWDEDTHWFIGNLAIRQLRVAELRRLRGRTANEKELGNKARLRLMKSALGRLFPGLSEGEIVHVGISTGLPVEHMGDSDELKEAILGKHVIKSDLTHFVANVVDVKVMPQPYGSVYGQMITPRGALNDCYTYNRTGVIDIGMYTIDALMDDNGEYVDTMSGSVEGGMHLVYSRIEEAYNRDFRKKLSHGDVEMILREKCFKAYGEVIDYTEVVAEALMPVRDAAINLMGDLWSNAADLDVIYASGGGAYYIGQDIHDAYRQTHIIDNPEYANAHGYLNYAIFDASQ